MLIFVICPTNANNAICNNRRHKFYTENVTKIKSEIMKTNDEYVNFMNISEHT